MGSQDMGRVGVMLGDLPRGSLGAALEWALQVASPRRSCDSGRPIAGCPGSWGFLSWPLQKVGGEEGSGKPLA